MSTSSAPPTSGGCGTFSVAAWNIRCGRNAGLASAAKGLAQMGVAVAVLTEMKVTDDRYPHFTSGYKVLSSKAASRHQGGIALIWRENHPGVEVEATRILTPNLLTFQLVTGDERYYCMGVYIPPNDIMGVEDLRSAWDACPDGCIPIILGDLNINFRDPRDEREEQIVDLLDEINLIDTSRRFAPRRPRRLRNRARWTWRHKREGRTHYSQPDYIMAREGDARRFRGVGFRWQRYHDSDHRAVVATFRRGKVGRLKSYRKQRQQIPLRLPPGGPYDELTTTFEAMKAVCIEPAATRRNCKDWVSDETWQLIKRRTSLRRAGQLQRHEASAMQRAVHKSLRADRDARTKQVGDMISHELAGGNVQEAFRHLKGWYRSATETQARPCPQTMDRQTAERVDLYRRRDSPGLPIHVGENLFDVRDDTPTDGEIRTAVSELSNGRSAGASQMRAEHLKFWLQGMRDEEESEGTNTTSGDKWRALTKLVQTVWNEGRIPPQLGWVITVLVPKGSGGYRGIGLLEPIWKVVERVMDHRLEAIVLHDSLHGCRNRRGTGTAVIEAKLTQQLAHIEQSPFYGVFIDLTKAFDAMDRERCLQLLEEYGVGPRMRRLIRHFWDEATNVCRASGNYGVPFKSGRGVTQGGPLSAKLFNIIVDAVVREWHRLVRANMNTADEGELDRMMAALFAIFYVDDAYVAARDPVFLQMALNVLVDTFARVGLETNIAKTQAMICTPGRIRVQLPSESYRRMRTGRVTATEWEARIVTCRECGKQMRNSSLGRHLADVHDIYQQAVVAEDLLEERESNTYVADVSYSGKHFTCPFPGCLGVLNSGWMMRRHFRDVHPKDLVELQHEGFYPRCERCGMQCNPSYPTHINTKECRAGTERRHQRDMAVRSALALREQFHVHDQVLERVDVFKYLGRLLAQDDDDVQAIRAQIRKARVTWARVSNVLRAQNAAPRTSAKFYVAVVQSLLLYGSETWVLSKTALARLEGFHIRAAYKMAKENVPRRGPDRRWEYPKSEDVLKECGLQTICEYIKVRRDTIAAYVVERSIFRDCMDSERKRGSVPRQWWWEQEMDLDAYDATGSVGD